MEGVVGTKLRCEACNDLVAVNDAGACTVCGRPVDPAIRAVRASGTDAARATDGPVGVGGWLLFFVACFTILSPLSVLSAIEMRLRKGTAVGIALGLVDVGFALACIVGGIAMWRRKPWGLAAAKLLMSISAVLAMIGFNGTALGVADVLGPSIWVWYLYVSKRVRNTYGVRKAGA